MAVISVNGVALPTPTDLQVSIADISKASRNANGTIIIERITTKRKLNLTYAYLKEIEMRSVLGLIASTFFTVSYIDPSRGEVSGTFYVGDRNIGFLDVQNNVPRYKDITFNFVEK